MPENCAICEKQPQKYKCSACRQISYCSAACFKKHEVDFKPQPKRARVEVTQEPIEDSAIVYPPLSTQSQVSLEQFERVAKSAKIRGCLKSMQLQAIIREVDGSANRLVSLQKMISRNEDFGRFVGFVIDCLECEAKS